MLTCAAKGVKLEILNCEFKYLFDVELGKIFNHHE